MTTLTVQPSALSHAAHVCPGETIGRGAIEDHAAHPPSATACG